MEDSYVSKPDNNLVLAILTTVFCCLPLGIVAIIKANEVDSLYLSKQYQAAAKAAADAKKYSLIGMGISAVCIVLYILFLVVTILVASNQY